MSTVIDDVATYLQANGIGTLGTNLFEGNMPPSPDAAVTILETGGRTPDYYIPIKNPTFQVLIRNTDPLSGKTVFDSIRTLLHNQYNVQLVTGGIYFYYIRLVSDGGWIGQDPQGRDNWSVNFETETR